MTFHLTRPDPDFLSKLTIAFADVLPATVPGREARAPLPATGPYMISRYVPGRELLMVRNPRFREWSAAAQPAGYPDQHPIRLDLGGARPRLRSPTAAATSCRASASSRPVLAYLRRYRSQLRINPQLITAFLFLNVNAPPFTDVHVRQAVNLALDRGRVVADWGGPLAARPACQILPPGLAGYRRYCPWTRDPGGQRPLARTGPAACPPARRRLRHSRDEGHRLGRLPLARRRHQGGRRHGAGSPPARLPGRRCGCCRPVLTSPYIGDSRNRAQVIDGGWSADYASADTFIGKLTCAYYVPGNSIATDDPGGLCDPGLDRRIAQAAAEQTSDPATAASLWARLDRQLTNLAIWVPLLPLTRSTSVQARTQLPVQSGLGSARRSVLDPVTRVSCLRCSSTDSLRPLAPRR